MEPLLTFLEMGGYGRFVWPAFAVTALVLAGLLVQSLRTLKGRQAQLTLLQDTLDRARPRQAGAGR